MRKLCRVPGPVPIVLPVLMDLDSLAINLGFDPERHVPHTGDYIPSGRHPLGKHGLERMVDVDTDHHDLDRWICTVNHGLAQLAADVVQLEGIRMIAWKDRVLTHADLEVLVDDADNPLVLQRRV